MEMSGITLLDDATSDAPAIESETAGDSSLRKEDVFDLLRNSRRRVALRYLLDRGEEVTRSELAEHIAAVENGVSRTELNSTQRKRVYVSLYQNHLPKMEEYGVISYDGRAGTARITERAKLLAYYLDAESNRSRADRWARYYLLLGLLGVSALALASVDWLFVSVAPATVASVFLSALLLTSVVNTYRSSLLD